MVRDVTGVSGYIEGLNDGTLNIPKECKDLEGGNYDGGETDVARNQVTRVLGASKEVENEKFEKIREVSGKFIEDDVKDETSRLRNMALQQAVSHGLRQAQIHQEQVPSQQQTVIRWERFLPQHQLRVLLVEDDDATRHVVSALLRNCSYEGLISAANGLLAWELLIDQSNKVDIVLTEVAMPCLSGIGLLTRIMSHEPLKHIPVIMMSSHDSMGVVFKCLSKGAVDFLVKPVRKNELKNMWQHIWRRCHSSSASGSGSGSGSISGSQRQQNAQPEAAGEANNSVSNDETDTTSSELNIGGGSDNGSGTQSSWTKKAVEVDSSHQGLSDGLKLQLKNGCMSGTVHQEAKENDVRLNVKQDGLSCVAAELPCLYKEENQTDSNEERQTQFAAVARDNRQFGGCVEGATPIDNQHRTTTVTEIPMAEESKEEQQAETENADEMMEKHASNSPSSKDKTNSDSSSLPCLNMSLKRPCLHENDGDHEIRGLKHSCSSAFSRYQNTAHNTSLPGGISKVNTSSTAFGDHFGQGSSVGSNHPQCNPFSKQVDRTLYSKNGSEEAVGSPYFRGIFHSAGNQENYNHAFLPIKHGAASSFPKEEASNLATSTGMQKHFPPSGMLNVFGAHSSEPMSDMNLPPQWGPSSDKADNQDFHLSYRHSHGHQTALNTNDAQIHHHSHHHHHHHHHIQHHYHHHQEQAQQMSQTQQQEESTLINANMPAPKCGSTNMRKGLEGNNCGSSNHYGSNGNGAAGSNGSASGSNNGSNGGQCSVVATAEPSGAGNVESGTQLVGGSGVTTAHQVLGPDQSRYARREAALTKFRQKRKERCFEKKVRYQSRKRLAEQRPRVRGQFVRQSVK
ncbi:hypothetical protein KP509_04G018800 [Ceratopteris richardii]|uniref:Uncharacterized protein n=1 Tax=Ceratopteris richardii TaxID=49495 RepID=A0A8T2UXS5_CERRI|nr:hypothetical protein KP509_04G018800 [Ceratopteris richardii]